MRDFVKFEKRHHYPHMRDFEIGLIEKFIEKYPKAYDEVAYSYPVGNPPPFNPIVNDETMGGSEYLYQRKIDMLCKKGNDLDIIEVKRRAGASTFGQIQGYRDLFERDEKPQKISKLKILTDEVDQDMHFMADQRGVEIVIV